MEWLWEFTYLTIELCDSQDKYSSDDGTIEWIMRESPFLTMELSNGREEVFTDTVEEWAEMV
jgi:hypothetical protein